MIDSLISLLLSLCIPLLYVTNALVENYLCQGAISGLIDLKESSTSRTQCMGMMNFMGQAVGPSTTYGANLQFRRQVELLAVIPQKQMLRIDAHWPIARWRSCTNNRV